MKKTLITLAALAIAGTASAASYTLSPNETLSTDKAMGSGWIGSLSDTYLVSSTPLASEVYLSQISLVTPDDIYSQSYATPKLAIFEYSNISEAGDFVALSTNTPTYAAESVLTFTFDDVQLDSTKTYRFCFVTEAATETSPSPWDNVGASVRFGFVSTTEGDGKGITEGGNAGNLAWGNFMPNVTYTLSNQVVPEPATATLSLLALAGLAARRRRK